MKRYKLVPRRNEIYAEQHMADTTVLVSRVEITHKGLFKVVRIGPDVEKTEVGDLIMFPKHCYVPLARGAMVEEKYIICNAVESDEFDETRPKGIPNVKPITIAEASLIASGPEGQA